MRTWLWPTSIPMVIPFITMPLTLLTTGWTARLMTCPKVVSWLLRLKISDFLKLVAAGLTHVKGVIRYAHPKQYLIGLIAFGLMAPQIERHSGCYGSELVRGVRRRWLDTRLNLPPIVCCRFIFYEPRFWSCLLNCIPRSEAKIGRTRERLGR